MHAALPLWLLSEGLWDRSCSAPLLGVAAVSFPVASCESQRSEEWCLLEAELCKCKTLCLQKTVGSRTTIRYIPWLQPVDFYTCLPLALWVFSWVFLQMGVKQSSFAKIEHIDDVSHVVSQHSVHNLPWFEKPINKAAQRSTASNIILA